jgi:hypothetical protein
VKRSEEKRREVKGPTPAPVDNDSASGPQTETPVDKNLNVNVNGKTLEERAAAVGLTQGEGEKRNLFMLRVASEEAKARATT